MERLLEASNGFFGWLWRASWEAAIVVMLVLLAQWVLGRQLTPRWRHVLWFLVVIRLALPGSVGSRVSLFNLLGPPSFSTAAGASEHTMATAAAGDGQSGRASGAGGASSHVGSWVSVRSVWLAGAAAVAGYFLVSAWKLGRGIRGQRPVTNEAVLNLLEDCKQEMGVSTPLTLLETTGTNSPALLGFMRPRLLLPEGLIQSFSLPELRFVFLHELGHLKRGDIPVNWLLTVPLVLHWFNPLVWYAVRRIRVDGELACDAMALSHVREGENRPYGRTIIKLLERFSAPAQAPGLAGVLEKQNQMKRRIELIARFKKTHQRPLWAAALFALLAVLTLTDAQSQLSSGEAPGQSVVSRTEAPWRPWIIASTPQPGESEVDPALAGISITFDRDMSPEMSWTGRNGEYPPAPEGRRSCWRDRRTCVLPVKLQAGHYYRLDINSYNQAFRGTDGRAASQSVLYFTTRGAGEAAKAKLTKPRVINLFPPNGATGVDPSLKEIRVTFNVPMTKGYSWAGAGDHYPEDPGNHAYWINDYTCVLPVALRADYPYSLGINSIAAVNFQSADGGVPCDPVDYTFRTRP